MVNLLQRPEECIADVSKHIDDLTIEMMKPTAWPNMLLFQSEFESKTLYWEFHIGTTNKTTTKRVG